MRRLFFSVLVILHFYSSASPNLPIPLGTKQEFYSIRIYQLKNKEQETRVEKFLQLSFLPALHRSGIPEAGVFKPIGNDTAAIRRIYVLIPFKTLEQFTALSATLAKDAQYQAEGKDYLDAPYDNSPYSRFESILLQAFPEMPHHAVPIALQGTRSERIYELRSYESPTEKFFASKVHMFNQGGEVPLFQRLGFNAVFYATVLSGSHMPNLMYMTSFDNMASRESHWKAFGEDPFWKNWLPPPNTSITSRIQISFSCIRLTIQTCKRPPNTG